MTVDDIITIHAVLLMLCPVATAALIWRVKSRRMNTLGVIGAGFMGLATAALGCMFGVHACFEGQPFMQWLLPAICVVPFVIFVADWRVRWGCAALLLALSIILSTQFANLVHKPGWTGNPNWGVFAFRDIAHMKHVVKEYAKSDAGQAHTDQMYDEGWIRDLPFWAQLDTGDRDYSSPMRRAPRRAWHTWFTGIYPYDMVPVDYWYPGGPLRLSANRIELRDRPDSPE